MTDTRSSIRLSLHSCSKQLEAAAKYHIEGIAAEQTIEL
jgi:hypothetical protein